MTRTATQIAADILSTLTATGDRLTAEAMRIRDDLMTESIRADLEMEVYGLWTAYAHLCYEPM